MRIGIICALEKEISLLREYFVVEIEHHCGSVHVVEASMFSNSLFLTISGVGKTCAAIAAQALISQMKCDIIINTGLAGGCSPLLTQGCAVLISGAIYHDFHTSGLTVGDDNHLFLSNERLNSRAKEILAAEGLGYTTGIAASGDTFVMDSRNRDDIVARTGCICVDMELAAIAHVASLTSTPYISLKIISDNADEDSVSDFLFNLDIYSSYCSSFVYSLVKEISY